LQGLRSAFGILNSPPPAVGGYGIFVTRHSLIRVDSARAAFESAAKADAANPLPLLALARMENDGARPAKSAALFERALEAFLSVSPIGAERDAVFELWEKADNAARR